MLDFPIYDIKMGDRLEGEAAQRTQDMRKKKTDRFDTQL